MTIPSADEWRFMSNLAALDLSLMLARDTHEHRPQCGATRRDNRGHVVAECSFHPGHENDHRDVHAAHTWT